MKKKEIKAAIGVYGYKMIGPSYFVGDSKECCIFNAYDEHGVCWSWYVNWKSKRARTQMLSDVQILESRSVAHMFWKE